MTDRLHVACEVTRRLSYLRSDSLELARLLQGETLSHGAHASLQAIIHDLQRVAKTACPPAPETAERSAAE